MSLIWIVNIIFVECTDKHMSQSYVSSLEERFAFSVLISPFTNSTVPLLRFPKSLLFFLAKRKLRWLHSFMFSLNSIFLNNNVFLTWWLASTLVVHKRAFHYFNDLFWTEVRNDPVFCFIVQNYVSYYQYILYKR